MTSHLCHQLCTAVSTGVLKSSDALILVASDYDLGTANPIGHEVTSVGWIRVGDAYFVGVCDNFLPVKPRGVQTGEFKAVTQSVRWVRVDAFESLLRVEVKNSADPPL